MRPASIAIFALFATGSTALSGCNRDVETDDDTWSPPANPIDADGDGVASDEDCDDTDGSVRPGLPETCDGADQDCDGAIDEQTADTDGDGVCDARDPEACNGQDDDGDGIVDEGFADGDHDGWPDCSATEVCDGDDDDGDGDVDEGFDGDADGVTACGGDCDDGDDARSPGEAEIAGDAIDQDCDGYVDEDDWDAGDLVITEALVDPASVPDALGEWFEVRNDSDRTVPLAGLRVGAWRIPEGTAPLAPAGIALFAASADPLRNGGVAADAAWNGALSLGNSGPGLAITVEQSTGSLTIADVAWSSAPSGAAWVFDDGDACPATAPWSPLGDRGSPGVTNAPCAADADGDSFSVDAGDCDDGNADTYPGAPETDPSRDQDCDGDIEQGPDVALVVESTSADDTCGPVSVRASVAPDTDAPVVTHWELAAPPGSVQHSDDLDVTGAVATFVPDEPGTYRVTAWATDAGDARGRSGMVEVSIAAGTSGISPVANAGENEPYAATSRCTNGVCPPCDAHVFTLNGGGSTDPEDGPLAYRWTVVSGWGLLAQPAAEVTTITVPGAVPEPGTTVVNTVFVSLRVTDCGGAVSAGDLVAITSECTGN